MEQNKLPKNIRQIGEKEEWIRVYIEDYVHTYIQRLRGLQENGVCGGVLLGKKQRINGVMHLFIRGAAVASDPFWRSPGQTPGQLKAESSVYFPDLEVCGFFVSSRQNRSSEVDLVRIFETHFTSEYQILFNVREQEEEVFSFSGHGLVKLAGYYIYYEKNEEMQSYIIRQESLRALERQNREQEEDGEFESGVRSADRKSDRFENPGKAGKPLKKPKGKGVAGTRIEPEPLPGRRRSLKMDGAGEESREQTGKRPTAKKKVQRGDAIVRMVSIAGIFILAFLLFSDQIRLGKTNESEKNSSGILSSLMGESEAVMAGADSDYIESVIGTNEGSEGNNQKNSEQKNDGQKNSEQKNGEQENGGQENKEQDSKDKKSGADEAKIESGQKNEDNSSINGTISSEGQKNGDGSSPINGTEGNGEQKDGDDSSRINGAESEEQKDGNGSSRVNGTESRVSSGEVFPLRYLVKKGDSLYSISEKYYGSTEMVDRICLENNISNPAKLKYGTVLTLPAR
ncbi:MAG: LysM peptidoglycan-binding domain-containing protein [Lachnospiraceae bacterium]|nr:LysM peptidoglycan-binding domain-containing protein [Lachnospiraceae bacterium]